jgi:NitT/TauT family transport system substrate-binding protein
MSSTPTLRRDESTITIVESGVFGVPEHVAYDHGIFERLGLDVRFVPEGDQRRINAPGLLPLFNEHVLDTWAMCEWGAVYRAEKFDVRPAHIAYLRAAVASQTIISFRDDVQGPQDLTNEPVGIIATTGQHYNAWQILEGPLKREEINLVPMDSPYDLLVAARGGELAAVVLMEPLISLALNEGAHLVAVNFFRGAAIVGDDVPREDVKRFVQGINEAVDIINADRDAYRRYITGRYPIEPQDLHPHFVRFVHASPYPRERFDATYEWMQDRDLAVGTKSYDEIVDPTVVPVGA